MDRAVSDVLGYVLIFSLIAGSVGLVYVTGYSSLDNVRDAERFNNAERAFDVLDSNLEEVVYEGVPSRATEIKLSDASLGFADPVTVNVSVDGGGSVETTVDPLFFSIGDDRYLTYSNGAIIRGNGSASVMRDEPNMLAGDTTIIPIIDTRARSSGLSGSSRILVRAESSQDEVFNYTGSGPYDYTVNVTTDRTGAWESYLDSRGADSCTVTGSTVSCEYTSDSLYVKLTKIDVWIV